MRDFHSGEGFESPQSFYVATDSQAWGSMAQHDPLLTEADYLALRQSSGVPHAWDPAEDLSFLLQETMASEYNTTSARQQPQNYGFHPEVPTHDGSFDREGLAALEQITADLPSGRSSAGGRSRARRREIDWPRTTSYSIATLTAALVSMVSVLGGIIAYHPLRNVAELRTPDDVAAWWPLLVYGPWTVASLSILRAAIHQRRSAHSWLVVLIFSSTAILLCLAQEPRTLTAAAAAALPHVASLACFHQLVRLITLTKPPRKATHRHRTPLPRPGHTATPATPHAPRQMPTSRRTI